MLANLKPAKLCEVEPNGMMLAVGDCKKIALVPTRIKRLNWVSGYAESGTNQK